MLGEHQIELPVDVDKVLTALGEVAEPWGAQWSRHGTGGELKMPVVMGLRRGWTGGAVRTEGTAKGTRLVYRIDTEHLEVQRPAVAFLSLAAVGALSTVILPFFHASGVMGLLPLGILLGLGGWFLVVSRLQTAGPEEFLGEVKAQVDAGDAS